MNGPEYLLLIGKNITKIRKLKGLTIAELGYRCDIEKSNLIPIEKGRINVTSLTLLKIAQALEVDVKEFFEF
ncbi:MAG: helix-turn-helix transcriptional regulator [Bacteroidota bacterium]|nr:helix-turn-helix transcriptional regulator [Bacteroidota bacterium]